MNDDELYRWIDEYIHEGQSGEQRAGIIAEIERRRPELTPSQVVDMVNATYVPNDMPPQMGADRVLWFASSVNFEGKGDVEQEEFRWQSILTQSPGIGPDEARRIVRRARLSSTNVRANHGKIIKAARDEGIDLSEPVSPEMSPDEVDTWNTWIDNLQHWGLGPGDARTVVQDAGVSPRVSTRENYRRVREAARLHGKSVNWPTSPAPEPGEAPKPGSGWPELPVGVASENDYWQRQLEEYGLSSEDAARVVQNANLTSTNRRVNRRHMRTSARQLGIDVEWPEGTGRGGVPDPSEEPSPVDLGIAGLSSGVGSLANALGSISLPVGGSIMGPLAVVLLLWFAVIKVNGNETRLSLLWRTVMGQTSLDLPPERAKELAVPVPSFVEGAEQVINDTGLGKVVSGSKEVGAVAHAAGTALNAMEGFMPGVLGNPLGQFIPRFPQ